MVYSLLGNADEVQDSISDLHSYPAVPYTSHDYIIIKHGVSLLRQLNRLSYDTTCNSVENTISSDMCIFYNTALKSVTLN